MVGPTPYRLVVFACGYRRGRTYIGRGPSHRGAYSVITPITYAYCGWTEDQTAEPWRLPGSGTFCFPGLHAVHRAARAYLAMLATEQVSVRTNQDREVYRYWKLHPDRVSEN